MKDDLDPGVGKDIRERSYGPVALDRVHELDDVFFALGIPDGNLDQAELRQVTALANELGVYGQLPVLACQPGNALDR